MNLDWHGHWRVKGRKGMPQRSALNGNGLQNSSPAEVQQSGDMPAGQLRLRSGTCRVGRSKRVLPCYRKNRLHIRGSMLLILLYAITIMHSAMSRML